MARSACPSGYFIFFFQAEDGIRPYKVTGVQTCALPISVAERAGKAHVALAIVGPDRCQRGLIEKRPHVTTEARVTPPERVKARPRIDDALARLLARR